MASVVLVFVYTKSGTLKDSVLESRSGLIFKRNHGQRHRSLDIHVAVPGSSPALEGPVPKIERKRLLDRFENVGGSPKIGEPLK